MALVLIAVLGTPAFAQEMASDNGGSPGNATPLATPQSSHNVIFNGGDPDLVNGWSVSSPTVPADDFVLSSDQVVTDIHFWTLEIDTPGRTVEYFFFEDVAGSPSDTPFASGTGILIDRVDTNRDAFGLDEVEYWVDLDTPLTLDGGTTYWLGLSLSGSSVFWETSDSGFGNIACISGGGSFNDWVCTQSLPNLAFLLTGESVVGGELLPIDSAALMLAGLQSSAIWMIPILAGAVGIGSFYIKSRMNKD